MATLAELELELGRERRATSRESRRARRLPATKPPKLNLERQEQLRRLTATGEPVRELAKAFGIGRATAYRYLAGKSPTDSSHRGGSARSVVTTCRDAAPAGRVLRGGQVRADRDVVEHPYLASTKTRTPGEHESCRHTSSNVPPAAKRVPIVANMTLRAKLRRIGHSRQRSGTSPASAAGSTDLVYWPRLWTSTRAATRISSEPTDPRWPSWRAPGANATGTSPPASGSFRPLLIVGLVSPGGAVFSGRLVYYPTRGVGRGWSAGGCVLVDCEQVGESLLGGAHVGEHALHAGTSLAAVMVEQHGLLDASELVE